MDEERLAEMTQSAVHASLLWTANALLGGLCWLLF